MPIAREYNPECVLVSAGFDAAKGHAQALGGYEVSPECKHTCTTSQTEYENWQNITHCEQIDSAH